MVHAPTPAGGSVVTAMHQPLLTHRTIVRRRSVQQVRCHAYHVHTGDLGLNLSTLARSLRCVIAVTVRRWLKESDRYRAPSRPDSTRSSPANTSSALHRDRTPSSIHAPRHQTASAKRRRRHAESYSELRGMCDAVPGGSPNRRIRVKNLRAEPNAVRTWQGQFDELWICWGLPTKRSSERLREWCQDDGCTVDRQTIASSLSVLRDSDR